MALVPFLYAASTSDSRFTTTAATRHVIQYEIQIELTVQTNVGGTSGWGFWGAGIGKQAVRVGDRGTYNQSARVYEFGDPEMRAYLSQFAAPSYFSTWIREQNSPFYYGGRFLPFNEWYNPPILDNPFRVEMPTVPETSRTVGEIVTAFEVEMQSEETETGVRNFPVVTAVSTSPTVFRLSEILLGNGEIETVPVSGNNRVAAYGSAKYTLENAFGVAYTYNPATGLTGVRTSADFINARAHFGYYPL